MFPRLVVASVGMLIACFAGPAFAQAPPPVAPQAPVSPPPFELRGQDLVVTSLGSVSVVALGCEGKAMLQHETRVLVTCARDEVVVVDVSDIAQPRVVERRHVDGDQAVVFLLDGKPWVRTIREEARPFDALQRSGATVVSSAPAAPQAIAPATVAPQEPGKEPVKETSLMRPARIGGITEVAVGALAFVNIGDIGGGALLDANVVHRFEVPAFFGVYVQPVGVAGSKGAASVPIGVFSGAAVVGVDSQWLEVGLGAGGATDSSGAFGFQLMTRGRIGPRDGLHFRWVTGILAKQDQFQLGVLGFGLQVPMLRAWALELDGEGGAERSGRGLVGVRFRAAGDGGPGTFDVTGATGFAIVNASGTCSYGATYSCTGTNATYIGPALSGSLAWRL